MTNDASQGSRRPPDSEWREAFIELAKAKYIAQGMKIAQAAIHAETDAHQLEMLWRSRAALPDARRGGENAFREWFAKNMPPGTVVSDPDWWADRIVRFFREGAA